MCSVDRTSNCSSLLTIDLLKRYFHEHEVFSKYKIFFFFFVFYTLDIRHNLLVTVSISFTPSQGFFFQMAQCWAGWSVVSILVIIFRPFNLSCRLYIYNSNHVSVSHWVSLCSPFYRTEKPHSYWFHVAFLSFNEHLWFTTAKQCWNSYDIFYNSGHFPCIMLKVNDILQIMKLCSFFLVPACIVNVTPNTYNIQ